MPLTVTEPTLRLLKQHIPTVCLGSHQCNPHGEPAARPYLDTRLEQPGDGFCEAGRIGYVVGAAQASGITAGVTHHTYIRAANGNASSDRFQLRAQRGHRTPANCFTTWCSFGDNCIFLVEGGVGGIQWSVNVPGVKDWVR